ncbi:4'-phosphopantetheinyl transferase family protein [Rhizosaccharibacter radicis]|uniref:Enterobactin synthase component D n=1 Tax=Rhizosaccharibacter radicis TaxID=2782605 RepID=A0ABT1W0Y5_9PROT|nr:4'-phosphopantetheinyl transferase superfamily protein [Acetobacteraceae bacterium KSS12]
MNGAPSSLRPSVLDAERALAVLLGERVAVAAAAPAAMEHGLFPSERRHVARAVPKRRAEFATGRWCARRALSVLGVAPVALVPMPDGSPCWPDGILGSLSHSEDLCVAAVSRTSELRGLGIDIERAVPLDPALEEMVCTAAERAWIARQGAEARGTLGKLFFSAKEAFYKCQHGLTKTMLDFPEVELAVDLDRRLFRVARVRGAIPASFRAGEVAGRFGYAADHLLTVALIGR